MHVVPLAAIESLRTAASDVLADAEQSRAERYRRRADHDRFVLGALLLRAVASARSGVEPAAVVVDRLCNECGRQHGRPRLPGADLEVSVSHSGALVVLAESIDGRVGVDVERRIDALDRELVDAACHPRERPFVAGIDEFLTYWCRKEAVLKATGDGLRIPMTDILVGRPCDTPDVVEFEGRVTPPIWVRDLSSELLSQGARHAGALAVLTDHAIEVDVDDGSVLLRMFR